MKLLVIVYMKLFIENKHYVLLLNAFHKTFILPPELKFSANNIMKTSSRYLCVQYINKK